jgi:hypothetical protein
LQTFLLPDLSLKLSLNPQAFIHNIHLLDLHTTQQGT